MIKNTPDFRSLTRPNHLRFGAVALLLSVACALPMIPAATKAQSADTEIALVSERLLFVVSGGFWQEVAPAIDEATEEPTEAENASGSEAKAPTDAEPASRRGYYRLVVFRGDNNTSRVHLQELEIGADGPKVALSTEIEEISELGAYVTDVRREGDNGQPGFSAFVFLKKDLELVEPETWTIFVDEFGDIFIEQATN